MTCGRWLIAKQTANITSSQCNKFLKLFSYRHRSTHSFVHSLCASGWPNERRIRGPTHALIFTLRQHRKKNTKFVKPEMLQSQCSLFSQFDLFSPESRRSVCWIGTNYWFRMLQIPPLELVIMYFVFTHSYGMEWYGICRNGQHSVHEYFGFVSQFRLFWIHQCVQRTSFKWWSCHPNDIEPMANEWWRTTIKMERNVQKLDTKIYYFKMPQ